MISKLLIAYDGSTCSDAALEDMKRAGLPEELEAVILTAAPVFLPEEEMTEDEIVSAGAMAMVSQLQQESLDALNQAHAIAEQGANRVKANFPGWKVSVRAEADSPAWAVIKTATKLQTDLIVEGGHRHSSAGGRLIMGSVSQRVLYDADCSVRLARCTNHPHDGPVRIVVGFDGSAESRAAVGTVATRRWPAGSEVHVVNAGGLVPLDEQRDKLHAAGLIASEVIKHGDPAHILIHEAEDWNADSIFVGTRNLHGLKHLLQGSVASAVAAHAQCSVEVVRHVRNGGTN
ncbi:MAG TPA: universal stress protein [Pyrinomonadaceae bacterium]|nr:universal stress protein [Pyrinomonadaceae bacterium]